MKKTGTRAVAGALIVVTLLAGASMLVGAEMCWLKLSPPGEGDVATTASAESGPRSIDDAEPSSPVGSFGRTLGATIALLTFLVTLWFIVLFAEGSSEEPLIITFKIVFFDVSLPFADAIRYVAVLLGLSVTSSMMSSYVSTLVSNLLMFCAITLSFLTTISTLYDLPSYQRWVQATKELQAYPS